MAKAAEGHVQSVWDWVALFSFAGLVTLMLQRSSEETPRDKLWHYAPPAIGCAIANQVGNHGYPIIAVLILIGIVAYVFLVLKVRAPKL